MRPHTERCSVALNCTIYSQTLMITSYTLRCYHWKQSYHGINYSLKGFRHIKSSTLTDADFYLIGLSSRPNPNPLIAIYARIATALMNTETLDDILYEILNTLKNSVLMCIMTILHWNDWYWPSTHSDADKLREELPAFTAHICIKSFFIN